mmetsp:Transcript_25928/g.56302  ORF Transcript_25928/g.56302 Transcript_25928/m.56302 type:complete len:398 (+) Transcript_25928:1556-2749(+)
MASDADGRPTVMRLKGLVHSPPMRGIRQVPFHSPPESICKGNLRFPTQVVDLGTVDVVGSIVFGSVGHRLHMLFRVGFLNPEEGKQSHRNFLHGFGARRGSTDVVSLARATLSKKQIKGFGRVFDEQKRPCGMTPTMQGKVQFPGQAQGELRDQLLGMLSWTKDIVGSRDDHRKMERLLVGLDEALGSCFGGRIRVARVEASSLVEVSVEILAVDLVCANVKEASDSVLVGYLQQHGSSHHICFCEGHGSHKGSIDVRLGREVHDRIDLILLDDGPDGGLGCDVAIDEGEVGGTLESLQVRCVGALGEVVEADEEDFRIGLHHVGQNIGTYEACTPGEQDSLRSIFLGRHRLCRHRARSQSLRTIWQYCFHDDGKAPKPNRGGRRVHGHGGLGTDQV